MRLLFLALLASSIYGQQQLPVLIIDGVNNHDWAAGTRYLRNILEGTGRFRVDVSTYPAPLPQDLSKYAAVINNFNGGHTAEGTRWPREAEDALVRYVRNGGGLVIFHAANNAFLEWREYNDMIGLGWRDKSFGAGLAVANGGGNAVTKVPKGTGLAPGHGPRQDFRVFVREPRHAITDGLPKYWLHPYEQLTHGQHGPAEGLDVLTYAYSEVSRQGEPMDWVRTYGKGRVYTTMLGHTWKDEANPNLEDVTFQALLARGVEWAATGKVTLPVDLGWKPLFNGRNLDGWEVRGDGIWTVNLEEGVLQGQRKHVNALGAFSADQWPVDRKTFDRWLYRQAWVYTKQEYGEFDLHAEYLLPIGGNGGISLRDRSRAHFAIGEPDADRPDLASFPKSTPSHIGYEIQLLDGEGDKYPTGSIYLFQAAKTGMQRSGQWNSIDIESRNGGIRTFVNGILVAEHPGDPARSKVGPIGLQLHDQFSFVQFRNIRLRDRSK